MRRPLLFSSEKITSDIMQLSFSCRYNVTRCPGGGVFLYWVGVYPIGVWGYLKGYGQELVRIEGCRSRGEW